MLKTYYAHLVRADGSAGISPWIITTELYNEWFISADFPFPNDFSGWGEPQVGATSYISPPPPAGAEFSGFVWRWPDSTHRDRHNIEITVLPYAHQEGINGKVPIQIDIF